MRYLDVDMCAIKATAQVAATIVMTSSHMFLLYNIDTLEIIFA